jgi:hypothetical protein
MLDVGASRRVRPKAGASPIPTSPTEFLAYALTCKSDPKRGREAVELLMSVTPESDIPPPEDPKVPQDPPRPPVKKVWVKTENVMFCSLDDDDLARRANEPYTEFLVANTEADEPVVDESPDDESDSPSKEDSPRPPPKKDWVSTERGQYNIQDELRRDHSDS